MSIINSINYPSIKFHYFFINGIKEMLSQGFFNQRIRDAKTGEEFTIKSSVLNQLKNS